MNYETIKLLVRQKILFLLKISIKLSQRAFPFSKERVCMVRIFIKFSFFSFPPSVRSCNMFPLPYTPFRFAKRKICIHFLLLFLDVKSNIFIVSRFWGNKNYQLILAGNILLSGNMQSWSPPLHLSSNRLSKFVAWQFRTEK